MILHGLCDSYQEELLQGIHRADDVYRMALYTEEADLDHGTTRYTRRAETRGPGYTAGGIVLTGFRTGRDGRTAYITFDDPQWPVGSIAARGALIYNATQENRAVAVFDFGETVSSTRALFLVRLPDPTSREALIRIGPAM